MRYRVRHVHELHAYPEPVSLAVRAKRLSPRVFAQQKCESTQLTVQPEQGAMHAWVDYFGNTAHCPVEVPHG